MAGLIADAGIVDCILDDGDMLCVSESIWFFESMQCPRSRTCFILHVVAVVESRVNVRTSFCVFELDEDEGAVLISSLA